MVGGRLADDPSCLGVLVGVRDDLRALRVHEHAVPNGRVARPDRDIPDGRGPAQHGEGSTAGSNTDSVGRPVGSTVTRPECFSTFRTATRTANRADTGASVAMRGTCEPCPARLMSSLALFSESVTSPPTTGNPLTVWWKRATESPSRAASTVPAMSRPVGATSDP